MGNATTWRVIEGDCLKVLPTLTERIDAVITDPPFGVNAVRNGACFGTSNAAMTNTYRPIAGDDVPFDPSHLLGVADTVVLWGANHYSHLLPKSACWLVWDKRDGCASNPLADCELAWTNRQSPARLFSHRWMGMIRDSEQERRFHPSQKPVALMLWVIEQLGLKAGDTVVDPYMGCGPVGVACARMGLNYIGIELDPGYAAIARRRIGEAANHLFAGGSV